MKIKNDLGLIFANAEMLYHFDFNQNDKNIYVGYTNGMAGYIAPKKEYKFKGYEVNGFFR